MPDEHFIIIRPSKVDGRDALTVQRMLTHTSHVSSDPDGSGSIDVCAGTEILTPPIKAWVLHKVVYDWLYPFEKE